ncbi:MAG: hypothetical protein K2L13_03010 [Opitutales bacterium]|nr:hypothetical protein [Opitutales bacterium]
MSGVNNDWISELEYKEDDQKISLYGVGEDGPSLSLDKVNWFGKKILEYGVNKTNAEIGIINQQSEFNFPDYNKYLVQRAVKVWVEIYIIFYDIKHNSWKISLWTGWAYIKFSIKLVGRFKELVKISQWGKGNMGLNDEPELGAYIKRNGGVTDIEFDAKYTEEEASEASNKAQLKIDSSKGNYSIQVRWEESSTEWETLNGVKLTSVYNHPELVRIEYSQCNDNLRNISFIVEKEKLLGRVQVLPMKEFLNQNNIIIPQQKRLMFPVWFTFLDKKFIQNDHMIIEHNHDTYFLSPLIPNLQDVRVRFSPKEDSSSVEITGEYKDNNGTHNFMCIARKECLFKWQNGNTWISREGEGFPMFFERNNGTYGNEFEATCINEDHKKLDQPVKLKVCNGGTHPYFQIQWEVNGQWTDPNKSNNHKPSLCPLENDPEQKEVKICVKTGTKTYEFLVKKRALLDAIREENPSD